MGSLLKFVRLLGGAITLGVAAAPGSAHAQSQNPKEPEALTLDALEARLFDHPSLAAMRQESNAARDRSIAARALPDPVFSVGVNNLPIADPSFNAFVPTNTSFGVRQQIPNGALRRAASTEASRQAILSDAATAMQYDALRAGLYGALADKRRIAAQRKIASVQSEKYDALADVAAAEIDAGRPLIFRFSDIDIERARIARTLADLDGQAARIDAQLINLVGAAPDIPPPALDAKIWNGAAQAFHAVKVAEADVEVADARVDQARALFRPAFGVQVNYQVRQEGSGLPAETFAGDDFVSGMVTFTAPLWAKHSQKPKLRAAKSDRAAAHNRRMNASRYAAAEYAALLAAQKAADDAIDVLRRQIVATEERIRALLTTYESGAGDYAPIIDGEIAILSLRSEIETEKARRDTAIARLNALLVTP